MVVECNVFISSIIKKTTRLLLRVTFHLIPIECRVSWRQGVSQAINDIVDCLVS